MTDVHCQDDAGNSSACLQREDYEVCVGASGRAAKESGGPLLSGNPACLAPDN